VVTRGAAELCSSGLHEDGSTWAGLNLNFMTGAVAVFPKGDGGGSRYVH
jgi:hypothetical protein